MGHFGRLFIPQVAEEHPGIPQRLRHCCRLAGQDRDAKVHALQQRNTKALVLAGQEIQVGGLEVGSQVCAQGYAGEYDLVFEA
jgi:hypothetical protein